MSYRHEDEEETDNNPGMLLNLSQKSNIFVADQTPTPTRLIKNCEEVGLFEDLRHVNPFDETFRRACEQNVQHTPLSHQNFHTDEESLHTPQVFPQFDTAVEGGICAGEDLTKQTLDTPVVLSVSPVENILDVTSASEVKSKSAEITAVTKYRAIAEKPSTVPANEGITLLPSTVQFVQPQLITVAFSSTAPAEAINCSTSITLAATPDVKAHHSKAKSLLLPKLATNAAITTSNTKDNLNSCVSSTCGDLSPTPHPEPSSASMTPTSQLPIKERLKAILSQSSKSRPPEWPDKSSMNVFSHKTSSGSRSSLKPSKDDTMERRRAASTRYRHKMRNEHRELQKRNSDLQLENDRLKQKIKQLESEVTRLQATAMQPVLASSTGSTSAFDVPTQIQIPASTIHLVMNIPKLIVPCGDTNNNTNLKRF